MSSLLQRCLFFALLVIVGVRPLIQETHDSKLEPFGLSAFYDHGPLPTLWINLAIITIFGMTWVLRTRGALPRARKSGLALGYVVVAVAAIASCFDAGQKRLAINATIDWLTLPLISMVLAVLMQQVWQMRLALAVIVASGMASAVRSYDQYFLSLPETIEEYEHQKNTLWAGSEESFQQELFERRLHERAAPAFFSMGNIAASYYVLTIFAALGILAVLCSRRIPAVANGAVVLAILTALLMTKSLGGLMALFVGAGVILGFVALSRVIHAHPKKAFLGAWLIVLSILSGVAGYALVRDRLPGDSLTFRWWYLQTTAEMVKERPAFGLGSEQYGRHYPKYKEIKSPEEVANPHNFLAHASAEWGLVGLAGVLLMLMNGSWIAAGLKAKEPLQQPMPNALPAVLLWGLLTFLSICALRIVIENSPKPAYVFWTNVTMGIGWLLGFLVAAPAVWAQTEPPPRLQTASLLTAGLFAFLVHNLITFALFVPGAATTFFALFAICVALRSEQLSSPRPTTSPKPLRTYAAIATTLIAVIVFHQLLISPVARAHAHLQRARTHEIGAAQGAYIAAAHADPLDPTPLIELAERLLREPDSSGRIADRLPEAQKYLAEAEARDPHNIAVKRRLAAVFMAESELKTSAAALEALVRASRYAETVTEGYPSNPDDHIRMAKIQARIFELSGDPAARNRAVHELTQALRLNAARPEAEVRKFSPEKVARLKQQRARLMSSADEAAGG